MNIINKVKVTICGKEYNLQTDETPEYLTSLAMRVDKEINDLVKAKPNFGVQNAAVFVALTSLDEAQKAADSIENVRTQIKAYVEETAKARKEKEKLADKNKALEEKIAAMEKEIKELKKRPPICECEQLVLENTISPAVTIYAEENAPAEKNTSKETKAAAEAVPEKTEEAPAEKKPEETPLEDKSDEAPAKTAECGSDASNSKEEPDKGQDGGSDGGAGAEAQNDGGNTQNDDLTPAPQSRKSRKKRR